MGRLKAVKNVQNNAQNKTILIGYSKIINATIMSKIPMKGIIKTDCSPDKPKDVSNGIHFGLTPIAVIP